MGINVIVGYTHTWNSQEYRKIKNIKATITADDHDFNVFFLGSTAWSNAVAMEELCSLPVIKWTIFSALAENGLNHCFWCLPLTVKDAFYCILKVLARGIFFHGFYINKIPKIHPDKKKSTYIINIVVKCSRGGKYIHYIKKEKTWKYFYLWWLSKLLFLYFKWVTWMSTS